MIYLDNGATSLWKPACVYRAVSKAMLNCANPGRGGYDAAARAAEVVYRCRERVATMFDCEPEQVVFTANCTHGLNIAIRSMVKPGSRVVVSGFEHNAVMRPLYALGAKVTVVGRKLFDWDAMLTEFTRAIKQGADGAVFTHVSNVFGYILPVEEMAAICKEHGVPFIIDAAQSAGTIPLSLKKLGAGFIAMPGHKGLLGPQGTGILLCADTPQPLLYGGTGTDSVSRDMPLALPERLEAGTVNVPGIAGLSAAVAYLAKEGVDAVARREHALAKVCGEMLEDMGFFVFCGAHQASTVSFLPGENCEEFALGLARQGIAVRAGLHCAPLAHESAGTLETGTVRLSFGADGNFRQIEALGRGILGIKRG